MAAHAGGTVAEDLVQLRVKLMYFIGALPDAHLTLDAALRVALDKEVRLSQPVWQRRQLLSCVDRSCSRPLFRPQRAASGEGDGGEVRL